MRTTRRHAVPKLLAGFLAATALLVAGCGQMTEKPKPRLVMFVGMDVSGSYLRGPHFQDSMDFLAHYLYAHLKGLGGLEIPSALFVGRLGGMRKGEAKTLFPIETFQDKSVEEIAEKLKEIIPLKKEDPYTDLNAFVEQVTDTVRNRKMILKPITVVMISDGIVDLPGQKGKDYRKIDISPLEKLSRNVTVRLLYTDAVVGKKWQDEIKRRRVKVWTQDASVMETWKDPKIFLPDTPVDQQEKFFAWIKSNVDFGVRMRRVD